MKAKANCKEKMMKDKPAMKEKAKGEKELKKQGDKEYDKYKNMKK